MEEVEEKEINNSDNKDYYSYEYWFNNNEHDNWDQGGNDYYVNKFYDNIVMKLDDIPKEGKILILGTHNCVAFDKLCPQNNCTTPMTFERGIVLKCSCDESEYSVHFGGAPQTEGYECPAREYKVSKNGSAIRISNF